MARGELFLALLCVAAASALAANAADARKTVGVYELRKGDFSVKVTNWGATIMSVILPDSRGNLADVVLGLDTIAEYVEQALKILNTKSPEEAFKIFTEGSEAKVGHLLREKVEVATVPPNDGAVQPSPKN